MAREFEEERLIIEHIWQRFGKDWLTLQEVADLDGCCVRTVKKRYGITANGISVASLAHLKCRLARK